NMTKSNRAPGASLTSRTARGGDRARSDRGIVASGGRLTIRAFRIVCNLPAAPDTGAKEVGPLPRHNVDRPETATSARSEVPQATHGRGHSGDPRHRRTGDHRR